MKTYQLKINVNNIKQEIEQNYFKYKDIFYKSLIVNLCIYNTFNKNILSNTIIDDSHYNQYLLYLANKQATVEELISEINHEFATNIFLDTNLYIEEFINMKHSDRYFNLYQLTIDDSYNIVITNKLIKKHVI